MAGYVKELLLDTTRQRSELPLEEPHESVEITGRGVEAISRMEIGSYYHVTKLDLFIGLESLYQEGQISFRHIKVLDLYLSGYSLMELSIDYPDVEALLIQVHALLEDKTGYTDERFLAQALTSRSRYVIIKPALRKWLIDHGRSFT